MTGYTVNTGSNDKFRDGWDRVFAAKPRADKKVTSKPEPGKAAKAAKPKKS